MIAERTLHTLEFDKILDALAGYTSFSAGREAALALRPETEVVAVRARLAQASEATALLQAAPTITLGGVHDVREPARRAAIGSVLRPEELLAIASTLAASDRFRSSVIKAETRRVPSGCASLGEFLPDAAPGQSWLLHHIGTLTPQPEIVTRIEDTFDDNGEVRDSASPRLREIRSGIRTAHGRLMDKLHSMLASSDYRTLLQEPIVTMRNGRYVVPVKSDARGRFRGIVHDQSASGQTVFMEPLAVTELNNRWRELQLEEEREIEHILEALSRLVGDRASTIVAIVEALAAIDVALARARYGAALNAVAPTLNAGGRLNLVQARHPLLTGDVVPIDVVLGEGFNVLVITGPNTGGKTVALKTVGLLTLMAQAGLLIPAAPGSTVAVFGRVWADIGDEQSIEQSLSTFSSHLRNIVGILADTGPDSLVLLDELGAGTDPVEGSALARSIIMELLERGARAVATTHYSELKVFAREQEGVENASVEFDVHTLSPTYRLVIGLPGRSQALAIARRLQLPKPIVDRARSYLSRGGLRVEKLLSQIQRERREIGALYARAQELHEDAAKLRDRLQRELEETRRERDVILSQARAEANEAVRTLRKRLVELESEAGAGAAGAPRASRRNIADIRRRIEGVREESLGAIADGIEDGADGETPFMASPGAIRVGDEVRVESLDQRGTVVALEGDNAQVQIGNFKLRRPLDDLQRLSRAERKAGKTSARSPAAEERTVVRPSAVERPPEVDIRGWHPDEVEPYLERYINDGYLSGMDRFRVIHGHGTGALRRAVREQLASHPLVDHIEAAAKEGGGEGVTVVTLAK